MQVFEWDEGWHLAHISLQNQKRFQLNFYQNALAIHVDIKPVPWRHLRNLLLNGKLQPWMQESTGAGIPGQGCLAAEPAIGTDLPWPYLSYLLRQFPTLRATAGVFGPAPPGSKNKDLTLPLSSFAIYCMCINLYFFTMSAYLKTSFFQQNIKVLRKSGRI